ncbi:MAG: nucleotidyltransferase domain-containing protein [Ilumatobacteraceae bacterium]
MDVAHPITTVIPGLAGPILHVLARTDQPLTGGALATLIGENSASRAGVNKALKSLITGGLVLCQPAGRANLYTLNRQHVAAPSVIALSDLRATLLERISTVIGSWSLPPVAVWMFGSAARGDGDAESDIDLLLVRGEVVDPDDPVWAAQVSSLVELVHQWTGNRCELLELSIGEVAALVRNSDPLIANLRRDAVNITGQHVRSLTSTAS